MQFRRRGTPMVSVSPASTTSSSPETPSFRKSSSPILPTHLSANLSRVSSPGALATTPRRLWKRPQKWSLQFLLSLSLGSSLCCSLVALSVVLRLPQDNRVVVRKFSPRVAWYDQTGSGREGWPAAQAGVRTVTSLIEGLNGSLSQDEWQPIDYTKSRCQPMAEWQTKTYPTCNNIHETSLHAAMLPLPEEELSLLGQGWFRSTWKLALHSNETVVLKTLRLERDYKREYYELHRRDAVAMERLTSSPFVVSVFGMCGNSAFNEIADFPFEGVQSLESFNRRMRGQVNPAVNKVKLKMAASVAVGLADIHGLDSDDRASMVHYDLNPRNVALFRGGVPKLNDFNIAEFLHYDPSTQKTCGFPSRLHEPWWRAPEEMNTNKSQLVLLDEKVDIYALGNVMFHILTTHSPHGKMVSARLEEARKNVTEGTRPQFHFPFNNSTDSAIAAMRKAIDMCYDKDPGQRSPASAVADVLLDALKQLTNVETTTKEEERHKPIALPAGELEESNSEEAENMEAKG